MIVLTALLMAAGVFFFTIGTLGLLKFPDALTRAHGAAKCDTLGALLCILGLISQSGTPAVSLKLLLIILFIWLTNPTGTHVLARAILAGQSVHKETPHADR